MTFRALILCCLLVSAAPPAAAWYVTAGMGESDVGLDANGSTFDLGLGETWPVGTGPFEVTAELAYAQRAGSQPMWFTSTSSGLFAGEAEVTLHMVRPSVFGVLRLLEGRTVPRLYAGLSTPIKVSESWDKPDGETNVVYGYEDLDVEVHLGASVAVGRFGVDFRWNVGLLEQLVVRDADNTGGWTKAQVDPDAAATPENGATVSSWQLGLTVGF